MAKPRSAAWSATVKSVVLTAVLTGTAVVAVPVDSSVHATSNPDLANGLKSAAGKLVETSLLPELNELLPGLATNPGQLFDLHHPFLQLAGLDPNAELESAIGALDGDGFTFSDGVVTQDGTTTTLTFELSIDRTVPVELGFVDGDIQLLGGSINVDVTMPPTSITAEYDTSIGGGAGFALVDLPRFDVNVAIAEALSESLQFGYASATAGGTFNLNSTISLQISDPDASARLTVPEIGAAAIGDLLEVSFEHDSTTPELDATIELTADVAGIPFTGTVQLTDDHLFEGDPVDATIDLEGANPIALLSNIGPDTALNGLSQILSGVGAGVIAGDVQLPFLDGGVLIPEHIGTDLDFDQVYDVVGPLYEYVRARSTQLNCGAFPVGADEPDHTAPVPAFPARDLEDGQFVACRAFAGEDPKNGTSVTWSPTGATLLTSDATAIGDSVGVDPGASVIFEMDAAGDFHTALEFTPASDTSAVTVEQRPATIQQLISELETAGALPSGAVTWSPDLQALLFDFSFTTSAVTRSAGVDAGNGLAAATHLTGLSASGSVNVGVGPVAADLKAGIILTDDPTTIESNTPPPAESEAINNSESRRFVIEVPASGDVLSVDNVDISATAGFTGRLGFLEVTGGAELTTSKPGADDPALAIQLTSPTGVTVGSGPSVPNAMIIGDLLADPLAHVDASANLTVAGDVTVTADALAATGTASFDFTWPLGGVPEVGALSTDFDTLVQFDTSETLDVTAATTAATGDALTPGRPVDVTVTVSQTDLLARAGLVGAILVRDDQPDCQITAVSAASGLTCSLAVPETFNPAQALAAGQYDVVGNTLTHLAEILDAIEEFATLLEDVVVTAGVGEDFELWGIGPADIATQARELRSLVDEFRGVAAAEITCEPTPEPDDPPDATTTGLPVGMDSPNIACHAANSNTNSSNVRWRVVQASNGSGAWVDAPGNTVGQGTATQDLTVPDGADTNSDGFIALGREYTVVVEWTDAQGEHRASLPPPQPGSLSRLERLVEQNLGLPPEALAFRLDAGTPPVLAIELGYGICSSPAPAGKEADCADMPVGPTPALDVAIDLGDQTLAGLSTQGTVDVSYAALGQFNIGVPLDGGTPDVLADTGLDLTAAVGSEDFGLEANIGPFAATVGSKVAELTGTALAGSGTDTVVVTPALADQLPNGAQLVRDSDSATCTVTGEGSPDGDGNIPLTCTGVEWAEGDAFHLFRPGMLKGQLGLSVDVDPGAIGSNGVDFDITGLTDDCGALPAGDTVVGTNPPPAGDTLACARLALAIKSGTTTKYLGELGFDLVNADPGPFDLQPTVVVPANFAGELAAALLDPSFLLQALPKLLEDIESALRDAAEGIPAAAGDPLRAAADGLAAVRGVLTTALDLSGGDLTTAGGIETALQNALDERIGPFLPDGFTLTVVTLCGPNPDPDTDECADGDSAADVSDISVAVEFGDTIEADTDINLGLEGLPLAVSAGIEAGANWSLTATVGLSREHGPYLADLGGNVGAFVNIVGGTADCIGTLPITVDESDYDTSECLRARLGFLDLEAMNSVDNPTSISADASLAITDSSGDDVLTFGELVAGDIGVTAEIAGTINIDLAFRTGIAGTGADLPSVLGTFTFTTSASSGGGFSPPEFDFANLHLDVGTYLTAFLGPVIEEINHIIKPFLPIVDTLTAPIPVVSDLAALVGEPPVTMLSLLEVATGANLDLLESILAIVNFVGDLGEVIAGLDPGESLQLGLGDLLGGLAATPTPFSDRAGGAFSVNTDAASSPVSPEQAGALIGASPPGAAGSGFVNDIAGGGLGLPASDPVGGRPTTFGVPGLSFPFLDDASQIFGLLVGRDAVLIRWDAGTMEASAGLSWDFGPIAVGPVPITISIGGDIGIRGRFAIGYDTVGIRQLIDGGSAFDLLNGIFIDDLDAQGNDVAEVEFFGRVWAGASVDLVIVSAGVKGGIELTFGLNLNDSPDPDGKLRIQEIIDKLANPICLFDVEGKIEAFLAAFVKIDLFFVTKEYSFELVRITLLEWSSSCEPPPPDLATPDGGVLYLNVGSRAGLRNVAEDDEDEKLEVRQLGPGTVRVSGYGIEEVEHGVTLIVGDAGNGDDELLFLPGGDENAEIPFTIPVAVSGGPGSDVIKMAGESGGAADLVYGDAAVGVSEWQGVSFTPVAVQPALGDDTFDDFLEPGAGGDAVLGDQGKDRISGGLGNDSLQGGGDADRVTGGPGDDLISGGDGDDTVSGGPTEVGASNDDDVIAGDADQDTVTGDVGDDVLFGDAGLLSGSPVMTYAGEPSDWADACTAAGAPDIVVGDDGHDVLIGGGGDDQMTGGNGNDRAHGCDGNDTVNGDADNDALHGDDDDDTLNGGTGDDTIRGGANEDVAHGDVGNDVMFGDGGADLFFGDDGDDIVVGDTGSITGTPVFGVADGAAVDQAKAAAVATAVDHSHGGDGARRSDCVENRDLTGDSDCVSGGTGSDALFGTGAGDIVEGNAGVDLLVGDDGDDLMRGGADADALFGSAGDDELYGESAADVMFGDRSVAGWVSDTPAGTGDDDLFGGAAGDHMEGDGGSDDMFGGAADDHLEGNDGADNVLGESDDDNVIGGSDTAGVNDVGDLLLAGGPGLDVIAGDNAQISGFDGDDGYVLGRDVTLLDPTIGGDDLIEGDADKDAAFGEFGDDEMWGDHGTQPPVIGAAAPDYLEGDAGDDEIHGEAGTDDIVGGNSAGDGDIDADRIGTGLPDGGETLLDGGPERDWIAGDNARMDRVLGNGLDYPDPEVTPILLFDLATTATPAAPGSFGGDTVSGGDATDLIFGQGGSDVLSGDAGPDYVEGGDGNDTIAGGDADDDLIGGGSANDGLIDGHRIGDTLLDVGETDVTGGPGADWIAGDNALVSRNVPLDPSLGRAPIELFDVQLAGGPAIATSTSGGDLLQGNDGTDRIFGQGNGEQPATQTDPDDGRNNDFVGKAPADSDFDRVAGAADDDEAGWTGDVILGGLGDDEIEGNHGNDLIFGDGTGGAGHDEDDIAGGGSADDGKIFDDARDGLGAELLDGADTIHGDTADDTLGDDDAAIGDNGWVSRLGTTQEGPGPDGTAVDIVGRDVQMVQVDPAAGTYGNDHVLGNGGHDEVYGQAGDDAVEGGWGSDAVIGDLAKVTTDLLGVGDDSTCQPPRTIEPKEPFVSALVCQPGTLFRLVELFAFDDTNADTVVNGSDVLLGGDGDDWMHGGAGADLIQGDGDGGPEGPHPTLPGVTVVADPNAASADVDRIFGGDSNGAGTVDPVLGGNGDAIWGGRGNDHLYGGRGDDMLDVRADPQFPPTWPAWAEAEVESYHDIDIAYGGYDQDALQANIADNGPVDGDRMFDWVGVYNITYLCPATYGAYVSIRDQNPALIAYLLEQAETDGALTPDVKTSSGGNEVAMVYKPDVKNNANPVYPGTPGHFFCG
jgi:Ca2+-binding RTX toxin-like protein